MNLKKGQVIYVDGVKYTVSNMIEYKEDTWIWQEYEIKDEIYTYKWLTTEQNENNQTEYYIYEIYNGAIDTNEIELQIKDQKYELYEKGRAIVNNYFGNADVDRYESCEYFDYISQDKKNIVSVEKWEDELEKSIGSKIDNEKIQIVEEIVKDNVKEFKQENKSKITKIPYIMSLVALIFIVVSIIVGMINTSTNNSIEKYLENQTTKYTYVTSITNNVNNKKAKVYKSSFSSIDLTVKDIIDGVQGEITNTIDSDPNTEKDGIGIQTKKEFAYIYIEQSKIYVQVSSKEYVSNSGTTYHSHHYHYYSNAFTSTRKSDTYTNYAYSARQKSVNSRTSSGGGTSSGK